MFACEHAKAAPQRFWWRSIPTHSPRHIRSADFGINRLNSFCSPAYPMAERGWTDRQVDHNDRRRPFLIRAAGQGQLAGSATRYM